MLFNKNMDNTKNLILNKDLFKQINLLIPDTVYNEQKILKIFDLAISMNIRTITINYLFIEKIWKWIEKIDINICAYINLDNFIENGIINKNNIFLAIKQSIYNGANTVDINSSNIIDTSHEMLKLILDAVDNKTYLIKLTINRNNIKTTDQIISFLHKLSGYKIYNIKTEEFTKNDAFKTKITDINAILDFIHTNNLENKFKLDIVSNDTDENGFNFYESTQMLYHSIFKDDSIFNKNCLFTYDTLRLTKILQQNTI